jgi:thiol:disulfide interchange protein
MAGIVRALGPAVLAVVLTLTGRISAEPDDDPFADSNSATAASNSQGRPDSTDKTVDLLQLEASIEPGEVRPGQTVRLTIKGTPKTGYHTYPFTQYSEDPEQRPDGLSQLIFDPASGLKPLPPVTESKPEFAIGQAGGVFLEHDKPFTVNQDILILPDAAPGERTLSLRVQLLVCDVNRCVPGKRLLSVQVRVAGEPVALSADLEKRLTEPLPAPQVIAVPARLRDSMSDVTGKGDQPGAAVGAQPRTSPASGVAAPADVGIVQQLALAAVAGFVMLLTPCVFPMIPITVSFFLKQGEKEHHNPLALAIVYSGTIVVVLTAAVLVLGSSIVRWANDPWLNLGMGFILLVFALSLFGMFELELPHFLTRFTSAREGQGGYIGAFFMALTFTINSFTCTGPFLGPLLSGVKELHLSFWQIAASAVAYSAAFAAPFFVLALFPRLLKALPKSGGWLNATKVVMGFVEVALALKFLSITDAGLHPGNPRFFNYETVLCTWMALAVGCGLYLLGLFRLPHDTPLENVGVPRLLLATFFLGLAVYMTPLLARRTPLGAVGEFLIAWLPQDSVAESAAGPRAEQSGAPATTAALHFTRDYVTAWEQAKKEGKLLFIDFTGVNCQNCRLNEKTVFPRPEVREQMEKFVRLQLYVDVVPDAKLTKQEAKQQADRNLEWQGATFKDTSLPLYVVLDPSGSEQPFTDDGKLAGTVKGRASGTITDVPEFVAVLRNARAKQVAQSR